MSDNLKEYATSGGAVKLMSLKKFTDHINILDIQDTKYCYDARITSPCFTDIDFVAEDQEREHQDSQYKKMICYLERGDKYKIVKKQALKLIKTINQFNREIKLQEFAEDLLLKHLTSFGRSSILVRVDKRKWMIAYKGNLKIIKNGDYFGLACNDLTQCFIYHSIKEDFKNIKNKLTTEMKKITGELSYDNQKKISK